MIKRVVRYPVSKLASIRPIRTYVWHRYTLSMLASIGFLGGSN